MPRRPYIRNKKVAIATGAAVTLLGFLILYDAWEGRGGRKPRILGPILPW